MPALLSDPHVTRMTDWAEIKQTIEKWPQWQLMSAEEEQLFFLAADEYLTRSAEKETAGDVASAYRWSNRANHVRNHIVAQSMRLVFSIAGKFAGPLCTRDDLISEGSVALLRAAKAFDVSRGFRFSTYATHAIRNALIRCIKQRQRLVAFEPSAYEASELVDDAPEVSPDEAKQRFKGLNRILGRLGDRDQLIIKSRYGLGEEHSECTLQRLADHLEISRERVRQLEMRALCRLREFAAEEGFDPPLA
ncbi:MAG: sigma-70 family RNA polymerase sigma factor [bacterium]|nr:sigma-70 family RNA polymerase sigma factor [bacterium]